MDDVLWSSIITGATALGAVFLTGRLGDRTARRALRRADYASLIEAAGAVLDNHQQMRDKPPATIDDTQAAEFNRRTDALQGELRRAVAVVQMAGSSAARAAAARIHVAGRGQVASHLMADERGGIPRWVMIVGGAGNITFEKEIDAFIDTVRPELVARRGLPSVFFPAQPP